MCLLLGELFSFWISIPFLICEFSKQQSQILLEFTVRKFCDLYMKELERQRSGWSSSIPCVMSLQTHSRLLMDAKSELETILKLRATGSEVNTALVMAAMCF